MIIPSAARSCLLLLRRPLIVAVGYPVDTARRSNIRHMPIGKGVPSLADIFIILCMPFDLPEAQQFKKDIFDIIYYHALKTSGEIAAKEGPYMKPMFGDL